MDEVIKYKQTKETNWQSDLKARLLHIIVDSIYCLCSTKCLPWS